MTDENPVLDGYRLSKSERAIFGGFLRESGYIDSSTEFIQCEVPIGLQRLSDAISRFEGEKRDIITDRSMEEIVSKSRYSNTPKGFMNSRDLSPQETGGGYIDAVVVKQNNVGLVELKNEINGLNDTHQGFAQLMLYRDMFKEDHPSLMNTISLSLFLVAGEWHVSPELIQPSYQMKGINVFEASRAKWVIKANETELPQNRVVDINSETLKNYDVPLAIATGGTASDLAQARLVMDNIDPYKDLDTNDFEKFD